MHLPGDSELRDLCATARRVVQACEGLGIDAPEDTRELARSSEFRRPYRVESTPDDPFILPEE